MALFSRPEEQIQKRPSMSEIVERNKALCARDADETDEEQTTSENAEKPLTDEDAQRMLDAELAAKAESADGSSVIRYERSKPAEEQGPDPAEEAEKAAAEQKKKRRTMLYSIAGVYLIYCTYKMMKQFIADFPTAGWTREMIIYLVFSIIFAVGGIYMLVKVSLDFARSRKEGDGDQNS